MGLDPLITTLRSKIRRVDSEILAAVRQQSANGGCSRCFWCCSQPLECMDGPPRALVQHELAGPLPHQCCAPSELGC